MTHSNTSHTFQKLDRFFPFSSQSVQYPVYFPTFAHSEYYIPHSKYLNQSKTLNMINPSSFDLLSQPTKRVKLSHQSFADTSLKMRENSHSAKLSTSGKPPKDYSNLTVNDASYKVFSDDSRQETPSDISPFGEELVIPDVNGLSSNTLRDISQETYQRLLQQLQQRNAQYYAQQQIITSLLLKQQLQHKSLNYSRSNMPQVNPKVVELYKAMTQSYEVQKLNHVNDFSESEKQTEAVIIVAPEVISEQPIIVKAADKETTFQYIEETSNDVDLTKTGEKTKSAKRAKKTEIKPKTPPKPESQKARRNKSEQYWSEYAKILGNNIHKENKDGPRNKNKWQCKEGNEDSNTTSDSIARERNNQRGKKASEGPKPINPRDIPQYVQDDSTIDYENLMSMTITNDPAYAGPENPKTNFVTVSKSTNPLCTQPRDTRVGARYQTSLPERLFNNGKRRILKTTWRPDIIKEGDLKTYFNELCRIFNCEEIDQEQALRLLKGKKYRKEGVTENISKNRKYYAKILIVPNVNNEAINKSKSQ